MATKIISYAKNYAASHWARCVDKDYVVKKYYSDQLPTGVYMVHYLNPTDGNGYRSILKLFSDDKEQLESLWNRLSSTEESQALFSVVPTICNLYSNLDLVPQVFMLGNNSQQLVDGNTVLGNDAEPYFLHTHFYGRGNPDHAYVAGIPLGGMPIGKDVNLRDKRTLSVSDADTLRKHLGYSDNDNDSKL
jgi:hypothetical protein